MSEFTKGPWVSCADDYVWAFVEPQVPVKICKIENENGFLSKRQVADSKLIAAAPEMYEILEALKDFSCPVEYVEKSELEAFGKINKVLAKVKG